MGQIAHIQVGHLTLCRLPQRWYTEVRYSPSHAGGGSRRSRDFPTPYRATGGPRPNDVPWAPPLVKGRAMMSHKVDLREMVGMALCALLSLMAFLTFLFLLAFSDSLPAVLALVISLACPVVWLAYLLWSSGGSGGLMQWMKRRSVRLWSLPQWDGQSVGVPVEN